MTTSLTSATAANAFVPLVSSTPAPKTAAIANLAVNLSNDSSLIASIGGTSTHSAVIYNAQGLMSNFLQASAQNAAASTTTGTSSVDTRAGANVTAGSAADATSTGSDSATTAGSSTDNNASTANGTDPSTFNGTPDWAGVLKANPSLTGVFLADSTNQLLVNQLSVFA